MDPRLNIEPIRQGQRVLSTLERINRAKSGGYKLNLCPCGCTDAELTDNGYCSHLVGFTEDGIRMEPRITDPKLLPKGCLERVGGKKTIEDPYGNPIEVQEWELVRDDDILVPISNTKRVYRGERVIHAEPASDIKMLEHKLERAMARIEQLESSTTEPAARK